MTASSDPPIEPAGETDLAALDALVEAAGWNQTESDWRLFLDRGRVCCIRDDAGRAVASAAFLPYSPSTAWISMVLTLPEARGQGHGSRLFAAAVAAAETLGLAPQLDATPLGRPIYEAGGFRPLLGLTRWRRPGHADSTTAACSAAVSEVAEWDGRSLGFRRPWLIEALAARGPGVMTADGVALSRDGRRARQIGPLVATSEAAAGDLLTLLLSRIDPAAEAVIDAVDGRPVFLQCLRKAGFVVERPFTRMAKGAVPRGDDALMFANAGPELG